MFLFDWFRIILQYFGFVKKVNLLIMGLDNAGKSTFLSRISTGRLVQHTQTIHPRFEELSIGKTSFQAYDMAGHLAARTRRIWIDYLKIIGGIVFLVDAADLARLSEARDKLIDILTDEMVSYVPVLILGNKIDKPSCYGEKELIEALGIDFHLSEHVNADDNSTIRPCRLVMCSLVKKIGYEEGIKWLANRIQETER